MKKNAMLVAATLVAAYRSQAPEGCDPLNMAKKETKAPAPATPAPAAASSTAPKIERGLNDKFVAILKDGKPVEVAKGAPQMKVIINAIVAAGPKGLTRANLVKNLTGVLQTRQPVGRIVSYYQKEMINGGYVTIEKEVAPAPATA